MSASKSHYRAPFSALRTHHYQSAHSSLRRLWHHPIASSLTIMVIAVAIALPTLLAVLVNNANTLNQYWNGSSHISVYLSVNTSEQRAKQIITLIKERYAISQTRYISPADGLNQFERDTGIQHIREQLHTNPLPGIIEITPNMNQSSPAQLTTLREQIQQFPGVDVVQLDLDWVTRLHNILTLAKGIISALAILLALAVLLVIGNTIRLATQNRQQEINVAQLLGATQSFIRRPFLYSGFFYGIFGAILAWGIMIVVIAGLNQPVTRLASSYHSDFYLHGLSLANGTIMLTIGALLGWLGAWLAVNVQLNCNGDTSSN